MEMLAAVVVASAAYVYAPLLRQYARVTSTPSTPSTPSADSFEPEITLPDAVEQWCLAESEPWAQAEQRQRAVILFNKHRNWDVVMYHLES